MFPRQHVLPFALAAFLLAGTAGVAAPAPDGRKLARDLYKSASADYAAQDYSAALVKLEQAFDAYDAPTILLARAMVLERMGRVGDSTRAYESYLRRRPTDPGAGEWRTRIRWLGKRRTAVAEPPSPPSTQQEPKAAQSDKPSAKARQAPPLPSEANGKAAASPPGPAEPKKTPRSAAEIRRESLKASGKCTGGDQEACVNLGLMMLEGRLGSSPEASSTKMFEDACHRNSPRGCAHLALGLLRQSESPSEHIATRSGRLLASACDDGVVEVCEPEKALLSGLCTRVPSVCATIGQEFDSGSSVDEDASRAATFYRAACDLDDASACAALGGFLVRGRGVEQDRTAAVTMFIKACDGGVSRACGNAGWMVVKGHGVPRNAKQGKELLQRACRAGHRWSCDRLKQLRSEK